MSSRFRRPSLLADGEGLDVAVEEHVERDAGFAVDGVVISDDELVEEGLVGDPAERIVDAHVDGVHVPGEGEAVVQVGFGLVVLDVSGVDLGVEEREAAGDLVLFLFEEVNRHGSVKVGVQEFLPPVVEVVAFGEVCAAIPSGGLVEAVELGDDEFAERGDDVFGYLDGAVELFDGGFDVGDVHGFAFAVGALGVASCADEVGVDHVLTAPCVGQGQP